MNVCARCSTEIEGVWIEALGRHPEHFICRVCGKPIAEKSFAVDDGRPMHVQCHQMRLPSCALCRRRIEGRYVVDAWGQSFCSEHEGAMAHCFGCGGLVAIGVTNALPIAPMHSWCRRCSAIGANTQSTLDALFAEVTRWGERIGMRGVSQPIEVRYGTESEFPHSQTSGSARRAGLTLWTETKRRNADGSEVVSRDASCVVVIKGAPKPLCQTILVHEMGHVWLCQQDVGNVAAWIEEGFCEYLAHRFNGVVAAGDLFEVLGAHRGL